MKIDDFRELPVVDLMLWLLEPDRQEFDFWIGCGILAVKMVGSEGDRDPQKLAMMNEIYRASYRSDRPAAERLMRLWLAEGGIA